MSTPVHQAVIVYNLPSLHKRDKEQRRKLVEEFRRCPLVITQQLYAVTFDLYGPWLKAGGIPRTNNADNLVKVLLDCIQEAKGINDCWLDWHLLIRKHHTTSSPYARVTLRPLTGIDADL